MQMDIVCVPLVVVIFLMVLVRYTDDAARPVLAISQHCNLFTAGVGFCQVGICIGFLVLRISAKVVCECGSIMGWLIRLDCDVCDVVFIVHLLEARQLEDPIRSI